MDILSFEKMRIRPGTPQDCLHHLRGSVAAEVFINGCPYVEIVKPYLDYYADRSGYCSDTPI